MGAQSVFLATERLEALGKNSDLTAARAEHAELEHQLDRLTAAVAELGGHE